MNNTKSGSILDKINLVISLCDQLYENIKNSDMKFDIVMSMIDELNIIGSYASAVNSDNISLDDYNDKLKAALNALEEKDYTLLADVAQYELKPLLEFWKENL